MVTRLLFLGTPDFAVPSLRHLLNCSNFQVLAVITQPDRPAGRGQKLVAPAVKRFAVERGLRVVQTERLRRDPLIFQLLRDLEPDLMVVTAFGQILPVDFFSAARFGTLNVHASLLPRHRGASPIAHSILQGDTVTGTSIMRIDAGMDTGDVLLQRSVPITPDMTTGELETLLAEDGARLLIEAIPGYLSGEIRPVPQDQAKATYAPRLEKAQGQIDWQAGALNLHNKIRAFNPWPVAFAFFRGETVKIWRSTSPQPDGVAVNSRPGEIVSIGRDGLVVRCGGGSTLVLTELQLPGRNRLPAYEVANGMKIQVGELLS